MKFTQDVVIGMECHVELQTKTKLFCGCPRTGSEEPNTRTCQVCLGHPGSKPAINKEAINHAIKLAKALGCKINKELIFSRKSYFYPDMSKNYQISQYEIPLATKGAISLKTGKEIGITRIHMEEDPAALVHPSGMQKSSYVLVDYNRSGDPLVEVVTEPELNSAEEAREFMKVLIEILNYLEIFNVNTCIIKADANVSIKETGYVRTELKNISGFKEIERALKYEVERQKQEVSEGKNIRQETRAWDSEQGVSFSLRSKETEEDYGYIIEPDLTIIQITEDWIGKIKMPELAAEKVKRYVKEHKLKKEDAEIIAAEKQMAELFEKVAEKVDPILAAKWLRRELTRVMNYSKKSWEGLEIDEKHLIELLLLLEQKKITETTAQGIMEKLMEKPFDVKEFVKSQGLEAVFDTNFIDRICKEILAENQTAVQEYLAGNDKSFNFLIGKVMQKTKGQAAPKEVNETMKRLLKR
ncbi:MAG: Asp-tRNA(Asn)/Glu-tRNA(Gln) amidotransferase subunit GatB [Candidatus Woesearchaeota archaeon]